MASPARRWDLPGIRLYSRAMTPGVGHSEFAVLYRAVRPVLPDLYWFVGRLREAFLLPPEWAGWPERATPFSDLVPGLRALDEHAVAEAPNVLDRCAGYVRDDDNELYGFAAVPDWAQVARWYAASRTHPALLAGCTVAFLNADAAYWACFTREDVVLDAAATVLQSMPGARVERGRVSDRGLDDEARRALDALVEPPRD